MGVCYTFSWDAAEDSKKFEKVNGNLESYYNPNKREPFERQIFTHKEGETIDQFVTDLCLKVRPCAYGTLTESMIRDQIVNGVKDEKLKTRLLHKVSWTLTVQ